MLIVSTISLSSIALSGSCTLSNAPANCTFKVQAVITQGCLIAGGGPAVFFGDLDFGSHPSLSAERVAASLAGNSVISLRCTPGTALSMKVDGGLHYAATRRVMHNSDMLSYQIYSDSNRLNQIGVNTAISVPVNSSGANITLPIYGELVLPNTAKPGAYSDTLTVTLEW